MAAIAHLPVELLLKILHFATHIKDPNRTVNPVINWHSRATLFFKRDSTLWVTVIATRASVTLVCRLWNTLANPWLYEHIVINTAVKLRAISRFLGVASSQTSQSYLLVKRLDIEVAELEEDNRPDFYEHVARVLPAFPNLVTLTMMTPAYKLMHDLLLVIPASTKHLFWSSHTPAPSEAPATHLTHFLDNHPEIQSLAFPFTFNGVPAMLRSGYRRCHPNVRHWIFQDARHSLAFALLDRVDLLPNVDSREVTWIDLHKISMRFLLDGFSIYRAPYSRGCGSTLVTLGLPGHLEDRRWPPDFLARYLPAIGVACPNLRKLHLTLTAHTGNVYSHPMEPADISGLRTLPQILTLSIQRRLLQSGSKLADPLGTLHHVIRVPWTAIFPSLQAIRIHEDLALRDVMEHPTMAFVREDGWAIQIEDRFGDSEC